MCKLILLGIYMISTCNISYIKPDEDYDSCNVFLTQSATMRTYIEIENDKDCIKTFKTVKESM